MMSFLSPQPTIRKTKTAVLVNALVFPGLGHFLLGYPLRGALIALAATAAVIGPLARVVSAVQTELLAYQAPAGSADFAEALALAQKIWNEQGSFATFGGVALAVVWGYAIIDAWMISRRAATVASTTAPATAAAPRTPAMHTIEHASSTPKAPHT